MSRGQVLTSAEGFTPWRPDHTPAHAWRRGVLALAVAAMGVIDVLSAALSHPPDRLHALQRLVPTDVLDSSRTFTLLAGSLLLVTAWGLRRGKRRAFVLALFLCAVSVPVNLLKAFDFEEATVATALMFALGVSSDAFAVLSREMSFAMLRSRALLAVLGLLLYAVAGSWIIKHQFGVGVSPGRAFADATYRLIGVGAPAVVPGRLPASQGRIMTWYLRSLPLLSLTLVVGVAIASLRPARHRRRHREQTARVRELISAYGESSIAWFALADNIDYFFSRNQRAVIAYRFESDTLLAIGDPIGPGEELQPLLEEFAELCRSHDWQFAFFQARPELMSIYESLGWRALHIGEDPVLWIARFTLEGGPIAQVRRAVRKAEAAGMTVQHFRPGENPFEPDRAPAGLAEGLRAVSDDWMHGRHGGEKGFCMGPFDPHRIADEWLAVAWNAEARRVEAFMTWVPIPARRGWALDLTRRRHDAPAGVMELIVTRSVEAARERGDALLSLSLSALARVDAAVATDAVPSVRPGTVGRHATAWQADIADAASVPDRTRTFLMEHLTRFYDFKGLFQWKRKFDPSFEDRYLVYEGSRALPRVVVALIRAQSPGGLRSYFVRSDEPASSPTIERSMRCSRGSASSTPIGSPPEPTAGSIGARIFPNHSPR